MLYNFQYSGQPRRLSEDNQIVQNNKDAYNTLANCVWHFISKLYFVRLIDVDSCQR
jgi:hypothetical protein